MSQSYDRAKAALAELKQKHEQKISALRKASTEAQRKATDSALSGGTGFALGFYRARYPSKAQVLGLDVELAAGIALHIAATQASGNNEHHLENAGNAALALAASRIGTDVGAKMLAEASK